eukprot:3756784-Prymnesium_polylepis.1
MAKGTAIPSSDVESIIHAAFDSLGPQFGATVMRNGDWVYSGDVSASRHRSGCIAVLLRELSLTNAERRVYGDLEATVLPSSLCILFLRYSTEQNLCSKNKICAAIRAVYNEYNERRKKEEEDEEEEEEEEDDVGALLARFDAENKRMEDDVGALQARADAEEIRIRSLYATMAAELNEVLHDEMAGLLTSSHIELILRQLLEPMGSQSGLSPERGLFQRRTLVSFLERLAPAAKHAVRFIAVAHMEHPDPFLNLIGAEALGIIDDDDDWQPGEAEMEAEAEDEAVEEELEAEGDTISGEDADEVGWAGEDADDGPRARPDQDQDGDPGQQEARTRVNAVREWCMASEGRFDLINILPSNILEHIETEQEMEELSRVLIEWEAACSNHAEQTLRWGVWYGLDGEPNEDLNQIAVNLQATSLG